MFKPEEKTNKSPGEANSTPDSRQGVLVSPKKLEQQTFAFIGHLSDSFRESSILKQTLATNRLHLPAKVGAEERVFIGVCWC